MDVRALRVFAEVVAQQGFTRAAAALHLSQPSVSKTVKALEDELGVPLLARGGRRVAPTDAGRLVADRARLVVEAVRGLEDELADLGALRRGRVRAGLPPMVGAAFFPAVVAELRRAHPGLALELREEGARRIEALVAEGELDVGVTVLPADAETFETHPFVHDALRAVLSPRHPLARRRTLSLAELAHTPLVLYREDFSLHDHILAACRRAGFEPRVASRSAQWDFLAAMAGADLGVALLPGTICERLDARRVAVVPLTDPIPWHLALIWRRDAPLSAAAAAFLDVARRRLPSPPPPRR